MLFRAMLVVGTIAALSPALDTTDSARSPRERGFDHVAIAEMARGATDAVTKQVTQAIVTEAMKRMTSPDPTETTGALRTPIPARDRDSLAKLVIEAIGSTPSQQDKPAPSRP